MPLIAKEVNKAMEASAKSKEAQAEFDRLNAETRRSKPTGALGS